MFPTTPGTGQGSHGGQPGVDLRQLTQGRPGKPAPASDYAASFGTRTQSASGAMRQLQRTHTNCKRCLCICFFGLPQHITIDSGGLKRGTGFFHNSGSQTSEIKVSAGLWSSSCKGTICSLLLPASEGSRCSWACGCITTIWLWSHCCCGFLCVF